MSLFTLDCGGQKYDAIDFETRRDLIIRCDDPVQLREALRAPRLQLVIEQMIRRKLRRLARLADDDAAPGSVAR